MCITNLDSVTIINLLFCNLSSWEDESVAGMTCGLVFKIKAFVEAIIHAQRTHGTMEVSTNFVSRYRWIFCYEVHLSSSQILLVPQVKGKTIYFEIFEAETPVPVQSNASSLGDHSTLCITHFCSPVSPTHADLTEVSEKH